MCRIKVAERDHGPYPSVSATRKGGVVRASIYRHRFGWSALAAMAIGLVVVAPRTAVAAEASASPPVVSIGDASVFNGETGPPRRAQLPITLSAPSTQEVTVEVRVDPDVAPVTFGGGVLQMPVDRSSFDDWHGKTRTVRFKPNPRTGLTPTVKYVSVRFYPDTTLGGGVAVAVILSNPTNAVLGDPARPGIDGMGVASAEDPQRGLIDPGNPPHSILSIGHTYMPEGDVGPRKMRISFAFKHPFAVDTTVTPKLWPGSPHGLPGVDYKPFPSKGLRPMVFRAGEVQKTFTWTTYGNDHLGGNAGIMLYGSWAPSNGDGAVFIAQSSTIDDDV